MTEPATQTEATRSDSTLHNKQTRGQFFTVNRNVLQDIVDLVSNPTGLTLEPSAGAGHIICAFTEQYPEHPIEGWELDTTVKPVNSDLKITYGNFFKLAEQETRKFGTIVGNPPFVAWKNVEQETREAAETTKINYSDKTNLYHLFIDKSIDLLEDNGQLIFIVPKEWMYATSALPLRRKLLSHGQITHIIDGGEEKVFPDADVPALIIFRYIKQRNANTQQSLQFRKGFTKNVTPWTAKQLTTTNTGLWFITDGQTEYTHTVSDFFEVKVGMVTGADKIYNVTTHPDLEKFQQEKTTAPYITTKGIEHYIDVTHMQQEQEIPPHTHKYLQQHKETLIKRGIAKFTEQNWWKHGAVRNKTIMLSDRKRLFVPAKTRIPEPFFIETQAQLFGGGILGVFLKDSDTVLPTGGTIQESGVTINSALMYFNSALFREFCEDFGVTTGNKVSFQPSTLLDIPFIVKPRNV